MYMEAGHLQAGTRALPRAHSPETKAKGGSDEPHRGSRANQLNTTCPPGQRTTAISWGQDGSPGRKGMLSGGLRGSIHP